MALIATTYVKPLAHHPEQSSLLGRLCQSVNLLETLLGERSVAVDVGASYESALRALSKVAGGFHLNERSSFSSSAYLWKSLQRCRWLDAKNPGQ